jgi:hypothetical protein
MGRGVEVDRHRMSPVAAQRYRRVLARRNRASGSIRRGPPVGSKKNDLSLGPEESAAQHLLESGSPSFQPSGVILQTSPTSVRIQLPQSRRLDRLAKVADPELRSDTSGRALPPVPSLVRPRVAARCLLVPALPIPRSSPRFRPVWRRPVAAPVRSRY